MLETLTRYDNAMSTRNSSAVVTFSASIRLANFTNANELVSSPSFVVKVTLETVPNVEKWSLIAGESANGKFGGVGSTFAFYAKLLASLSPKREEECRDAARMTLRMPLPSLGLSRKEYVDVARMAGIANPDDDGDVALRKMLDMYEKIREHERDDTSRNSKTPRQIAMDDANYLLDLACLTGRKYGEVRGEIAKIYRGAGMEDDARFVERCS